MSTQDSGVPAEFCEKIIFGGNSLANTVSKRYDSYDSTSSSGDL